MQINALIDLSNKPAEFMFDSSFMEHLCGEVIKRVRANAGAVELPKRLTFGGDCEGNVYFVCKTKAIRDLIVQSIKQDSRFTIKS